MFVDRVKVTLLAGKGGNGCLSFRREWGVPRGGPDGGQGGKGGSIYLESDKSIKSLTFFRYHPINKAQKGAHGEGAKRHGKQGKELVLKVPTGTVVKEEGREEIIFDFIRPDQKFLAARGGDSGRGNASFASPTHQAPRKCEEGKPGEEKVLILELKLIADVGLLGFPNVGKSTLISNISSAKPVIADYPFTTLVPNLGVVDVGDFKSFVVADIPGLIEGAHQGHGLGIKFLKHVERTKILVHLLDVSPYTQRNPVEDFQSVMKELEAYDSRLSKRCRILVANKIDILGNEEDRLKQVKRQARDQGMEFFAISALKKTGLKELVSCMSSMLDLTWES